MTAALGSRVLPRYALPATGLAVVAGVLALAAASVLRGTISTVLTAAAAYTAAQTVLSGIVEGRRRARDRLWTVLVGCAFALAALPLLLIGWYTVRQGMGVVNGYFLSHSMFRVDPEEAGGGVFHAIMGTLIQSLLATAIAAPLGIMAAVYLVEFGRGRRFARVVGYSVDVMTGVPSIVAGLFVYTTWILVLGMQKSGLAGALALSMVMLPVVIRSTCHMLRLVPDDLREAAYALGVPQWRTIVSVVLPTALGGVVTGVMLGVARVAGETAPLLLLVGINQRTELNPFTGLARQRPQESLPTLIYEQFGIAAGNTSSPPFQRAWGAALVLIVLVGLLNLAARLVARFVRMRRS
ncbi:MAG TPA: phosphate ABC transporter permease PstA [Rugosimonospora sp.]|nr:phosphate ABC transporter permease PstA [Rugosimonospora sp.]